MQLLDYTRLKEITQNHQAFFCFDFDGTLADIVNNYNDVSFTQETRTTLQNLNQAYFVSILTGRSLNNIQKIISLPSLTYAGNHGLEIQLNPDSKWEHPDIPQDQLKAIRIELNAVFRETPGVKIEDKNLSIAVHFRQARFKHVDWINLVIENTLKNYQDLFAFAGKKVINIFPNIEWDKSKALAKIIDYHNLDKQMPIYFGDDSNDEAAFALVNAQQGISVQVGEFFGQSLAKYYIENPEKVRELIKTVS